MEQGETWFKIDPVADANGSRARVQILDEIGRWGVGAKDFTRQIDALKVDTLEVVINSPGGSVFEGRAIFNALQRHPARVEVTVDGWAASIASLIAMAGDRIVMNRGAMMMIHEASLWVGGNAEELRKASETVDKLSAGLAETYAARAGGDAADWREKMRAETWFTAVEAVEAGLADEAVDAPAAAACFDMERLNFKNLAGLPVINDFPAVPGGFENKRNGDGIVNDFLNGLRASLGLPEDAAEDAVLAAVGALKDRGDVVAGVPEGAVMMDAAALADLQAAAADGRAARAELDAQRRQRVIADALAAGKITPASVPTWEASLVANEEGTVQLLAGLVANVVPVAEIGHSEQTDVDAALFEAAFGSKEA